MRYHGVMSNRQPPDDSYSLAGKAYLPDLWLLSDPRNDAVLETRLADLPRGSGFVFRHYHLPPVERRARFDRLKALADTAGHVTVLSGEAGLAGEWGAAGFYGPPGAMGTIAGLLRLATAHDADEIDIANEARVDAVFLSPVFPTRSHPGARTLGPAAFHRLARSSTAPVIALGGMNAGRARELGWPRWGAIDGLMP